MNRNANKKLISIACCCYNEADNIEDAVKKILWLIEQCPQYDFEIVFADNGSTDGTRDILRRIASEDKRFKVILNMANFGIDYSSANLLSSLSGDAYIPYPVDMQEPIEELPQMLQLWESGYDVVWGQKVSSGEKKIKYLMRSVYYALIDFFSYYKIPHQVTGFGVTDRAVLNAIIRCKLQDPHVSARILVPEYGFKVKIVPYCQNARKSGKSSYDLASSIGFGIDSLCGNSTKPLRIMMMMGMWVSILTALAALIYFAFCLLTSQEVNTNVGSCLLIPFFVLGVLQFCLGLVAEYISIALRKVTAKAIVIEEERINFSDNEPKILVGGAIARKYNIGDSFAPVSTSRMEEGVDHG